MQGWLWKQVMAPGLIGFFFALGQFLVYLLTQTSPFKTLESWIVVDNKSTSKSSFVA
jgi:hypothetical protein